MKMKRVLSAGLIGAMALSTLAFTGCGSNSGDGSGGDTNFSWWIYSTDGQGVYYDDYADNPAVQWLNQQYWDVENGDLARRRTAPMSSFLSRRRLPDLKRTISIR